MSNTVIQTKHRFRLALGRGPEAVTASALTVAATATTAVTHGRRIAQRQCRGMGVGRLDTLHLPGYAVGPFLVTNSDELEGRFRGRNVLVTEDLTKLS